MDEEIPKNPTSAPSSSSAGAQIAGNVNTEGGDLIGRDKTVGGDEVRRDKVGRDVYYVSGQQVVIHQYQPTYPPVPDSTPVGETPAPGESPYKGLESFDIVDAGIFFGREQLTAELVTYLHQHRFLAVVGASGSGKSSIVRAGLAPALKRGEPLAGGVLPPKGSTHWQIHILTPKAHPLKELAASLTHDSDSDLDQARLMDELAQDARVLDLRVSRRLSRGPADRLLLVVDQFEELFTLCRDAVERQAFVDNLLAAAVDDGVTTVVITLRADFYHRCADFANLRLALQENQKYIGPMSEEELRRAIEEPARIAGWELEPGLVDLLVDDVAAQPGALPLLSHALLETWKRRRGRTLTLTGYAASGRVQGAIAQTAEFVLNQQLTAEQRSIARNIFVRLTELGEGVQDTRRRVALAELMPKHEGADAVEKVIRALADARLITTDQDEIEVAHEALIREWETLREWLHDDREGLRIHRHLTEAAQAWLALRQDPGELYRGARLDQVLAWAETHAADLNEQERAFLDASLAERQRAIDEKERSEREREESRQRELREARKARNRSLLALIATVATLVLAVISGIILYQQVVEQNEQIQADNAQRRAFDALSEARRLKEALDGEGAIARFQEADSLAAVARIDLGIDLSTEITETRRYVATGLVQAGEAMLRDASGSDSDEVRQTAYVSATALFSQALALQPPVDAPVYVWIEPGVFLMGSSGQDPLAEVDETPQHEVHLGGYWIMRTEVTNEQYKRCVAADVCEPPANERWHREEYAREPVTEVDWRQANDYAGWAGGRLPTEAEWEKACRGADGRIYPWGNEEPSAGLLNYYASRLNGVAPAGSYPPGAHGLYDMAGNVWEWTADWYNEAYYAQSPSANPQGPESGGFRTLRGGSWFNGDDDVRCAVRDRYSPDHRDLDVGFRVASPGS